MNEANSERGVPFVLNAEATLNHVTEAYLKGLLEGDDISNPLFESMAFVPGKGWLRVSFSVQSEWVLELPEEVKQAMRNSGMELPSHIQEMLK